MVLTQFQMQMHTYIYIYISKLEKKYVTRYNAHALSTVPHNLLLLTLATVIKFCNAYIIVMDSINVIISGRIILKIILYISSGLKFEKETRKILHLEHGFVWC